MTPEQLGLSMQGGTLRPLPPNATKEEQTAVINDIIDRINDQLKSQLFTDGSSKRFIQGYLPGRWPDGDFGLAISAEGDDVTKVDFDQLIFAWDFTTNKQYFRDGTQYYYDRSSGINHTQIGTLPNGKGGVAVARDGSNVSEAY